MPRVLVLNNYSFERVWDDVRHGLKPDHHLYGLNYFAERGYQVELVPFRRSRRATPLQKISRRLPTLVPMGDLEQQRQALRLLRRGDLIYAPCQSQTRFLCYLRALGFLRAPIINVAHHPLQRGRLQKLRDPFDKLFVRGSAAFPALGAVVAAQINALSASGVTGKSRALTWGPDAGFYPAQPQRGQGIVAAGRTGRDFETLGKAASQTQAPLHIICPQSEVSPAFASFSANVKITADVEQEHMKYPELLQLYARARALAIPLFATTSLAGLTSLVDALGMGKPVIMTRNALVDLDIEAHGIGRWVDAGDVEGWRAALQWFEENEEEAFAMGQRARALVDNGYNSATFAGQIMDIFGDVTQS